MNFPTLQKALKYKFTALILLTAGGFFIFGHSAESAYFSVVDGPLTEVDATVKEAENLVKKAEAGIKDAEPLKIGMEGVATKNKADTAIINEWRGLAEKLKENSRAVIKRLNDDSTALTTQDKKVGDLIKKIDELEKTPETEEALKKLRDIQKKLQKGISDVGKIKDDLKTVAEKVFKSADAVAKDLAEQNKKLTDLPAVADTAILYKNLPDQLAAFSSNIILQGKIDRTWKILEPELKIFSTAPPINPTASFTAAKSTIENIFAKYDEWLANLVNDVNSTNQALLDMRVSLDTDLTSNSVQGLKLLNDSEIKEQKLSEISKISENIIEQIKENESLAADIGNDVKTRLKELETTFEKMPSRLGLVREGLAGDFKQFVAEFVPLYYFTDVFNLMKILNPETREIRDVSALKEEAEAARRKLDRADLDLANAQAELNELQTRVRNLENELVQAENNFNVSNRLLTQATRRLSELESRPNPDAGKIRQATERKADLEAEKAANKEEFDKLKDEKTGLPAKINEARNLLLQAQKKAREARTEMIQFAQIESTVFAEARDNEKVFFAPNVVTSKDPVKQVIIYAFSSRKTVYLRGTQANVDEAKAIIALLDRPAPQARLNLWTLELNGLATIKGTRRFNKSLELIEQRLSDTRLQIAATLSFLRDTINEEVNGIALTKLKELEDARLATFPMPVNGQRYVAPQNAEDLRWARMFFYQREVLFRLGFDPEIDSPINSRNQPAVVNRSAIPDPAGTTTLGEALIILTLANPSSRYEILKKFSNGLDAKLASLGLCNRCSRQQCNDQTGSEQWFVATKRALGADLEKPYRTYPKIDEEQLREGRPDPQNREYFPSTYGYTSSQREIVNAISLALVPRLINRLKQLQKEQSRLAVADVERGNINREIANILNFLWDTEGISPARLLGISKSGIDAASQDSTKVGKLVNELSGANTRTNILRTANSKVARTDGLLRQMIDAVDEDINRHFIDPMMSCLRKDLADEKGIALGVINRTSVLATNRLIARVDPRSSAQLSLGEEQNALAQAQQLANLFLAAKTGGLLGGLTGLGGLQQQKDVSEIYGLTSGSVFKVNPIFDPTGQSLRFQFDFVGANLVTNPDGSVNPQLPRIERHTVNTEVQLNNFELREITRFNSNARVGIPTTYSGGIPILKDLPIVKYVPLLGWFVRKSGKAAVVQESLMFGQTTMYPTIADLFDLLSQDDYNFLTQNCNYDDKTEPVVNQDSKTNDQNRESALTPSPTPKKYPTPTPTPVPRNPNLIPKTPTPNR